MNKQQRLETAIADFAGDTGPVTWAARSNDDATVMLVGTYDGSDAPEDGLTDEPWKLYGGDAIIEASGLKQIDSGIDGYEDKWGDDVASQWVVLE